MLNKKNKEILDKDKFYLKNKDIKIIKKEKNYISVEINKQNFEIGYDVIYNNKEEMMYKVLNYYLIDKVNVLSNKCFTKKEFFKLSRLVFPTKNQHFVDKDFLLKGWEISNSKKINLLSYKHSKIKCKEISPKNIFVSDYTYSYLYDNKIYYLEDSLISYLENQFRILINKIRNNKKKKYLTSKDADNLFRFYYFMVIRNPYTSINNGDKLIKIILNSTKNNIFNIDYFINILVLDAVKVFNSLLKYNFIDNFHSKKNNFGKIYCAFKDLRNYKNEKKYSIPLAEQISINHIKNIIWHKKINFDFVFFPISEYEYLLFFLKKDFKKIKKLHKKDNILFEHILEFYIYSNIKTSSGETFFIYNKKNINLDKMQMIIIQEEKKKIDRFYDSFKIDL